MSIRSLQSTNIEDSTVIFANVHTSFGYGVQVGMLTFSFFLKRSFRYENDDEKSKTKRSFFQKVSFLKMVVLQNDRFYKNPRFANDC